MSTPSRPARTGDESRGLAVRDAHSTHSGVHADLDRDRGLAPGGDPLEGCADIGIDHGRDSSHHRLLEVHVIERPHQQDRFADSGVPEFDGLAELHHRHARHCGFRLEDPGHVDEAHPVGVVLDDRQDRTAFHQAGDFADVVPHVSGPDLDPRIEPRVALRGARGTWLTQYAGGERGSGEEGASGSRHDGGPRRLGSPGSSGGEADPDPPFRPEPVRSPLPTNGPSGRTSSLRPWGPLRDSGRRGRSPTRRRCRGRAARTSRVPRSP